MKSSNPFDVWVCWFSIVIVCGKVYLVFGEILMCFYFIGRYKPLVLHQVWIEFKLS